MAEYAAVIDVTKCVDCRCCVILCKDEYARNDYPPYSAGMPFRGQKWIRVENLERGTYPKVKFSSIPVLCMQCDNPPCMAAATGGAIYKRPDGIVIIDPVKSKGQKQIVGACPYGVIYYNDEKDIPQKCTFCVHRIDKGEVPRCMMACPAGAIKMGDYGEIMKEAARAGYTQLPTLHPEYDTQNRVYYIGLPKTFITGALEDSRGECLQGADVTAKATDTGVTMSTKSDAFGDFWFDGLTAKKTYEVTISAAGKTKTLSVSLDKDTNLGDIQL
jgi:Fe-S-cluster-containing dehydrogenase component